MNSMTGFGRAEGIVGLYLTTIEIKAVNHRFLDCRFRLPPTLTHLELPLLEHLKTYFERGSFEIIVKQKLSAKDGVVSATRFIVDESAAKSLHTGFDWLKREFKLTQPLSVDSFLMSGKVFMAVDDSTDTAVAWPTIKPVFEEALLNVKKMRSSEGDKLQAVLTKSLGEIEGLTKKLREYSPLQMKAIKEKMEQRLQNWNLKEPIDAARLEWEIALLAEKADFTEEMDRLDMHVEEFGQALRNEKSVGRKLDFLTQELHREVNTTSSKASLIEVTRIALELKGIVEKLREQVQNVE
mgnify:CR=1 FL=1